MLRRTALTLLFLILLGASGCQLLGEPPQPVIPTPIPTALPLPGLPGSSGEQVTDPVSDVVPGIDPDISALINAVSQQQLMVYVQTLESFGTRNSFSAVDRDDRGIGAARRWIFSEFERVGNGRLQVEFDDFNLSYNGAQAEQRNVVATLPGRDVGGGVIIVMAHYDNRPQSDIDGFSRASGANDNASGVALLLETARILSSREWSQTIKFVAMAAEEQGTFGSRHFAQNAFLDNLNVIAAVNYDAVGGRAGIPQSVRLFAQNLRESPSGQLGRYYDYVSGLYLPTFPVVMIDALDREGRWGDHREFVNVGMPAIRVIESDEDPDLINSLLDTWTNIDYSYLQKVVQLNVAVLSNAAGAPPVPVTPTIVPMADPGSYLLNWPVDQGVQGFAISFRPINNGRYEPFRFVRGNMAGNVVLTGYDPNETYAVSIAALDQNGRLGMFTPEVLVGPPAIDQGVSVSVD
ncbi:MAG: M20/M25/M40 family metallo-hydrolase [Candidatus Promineifilaceae bacterium]|nr:M20/M25/M40 family metallo-hydrolase [Candidatus Promineifilaceae bacterium]